MCIDKNSQKVLKKKKEGVNMAVLAKPCSKLPFVPADKSKEFIIESNKNKLTPKFFKKCEKSSSIFKKDF